MINKIILVSLVAFSLFTKKVAAQDTLEILNSFVLIELDTVQSQLPLGNLDSAFFCVKVLAVFSDTSKLDSIHVRVGRTLGGNDVAAVDFSYGGLNVSPNLSGLAWNEQGFEVCVAPLAQNVYTLFLEIWADDRTGYTTPIYKMRIN